MVFLVESIQQGNNTNLVVFYRDENNKKHTKLVKDFKPYFYVNATENIPDDNRIVEVIDGFTNIYGDVVKKIVINNSYDTKDLIQEYFSKSYEADVQLPTRYLIDEVGVRKTYPLRHFYFDIETDDFDGFPDIENPNNEVISISFKDDFTGDAKKLFYKHENTVGFVPDENTNVYKDEVSLLRAFCNYIKEYDPDIISGFYCSGFDWPYLIRRMDRLGVDYSNISPMNLVKYNDKFEEINIKGRIPIDMKKAYEFFRKISNQGKAESYSLEFTAQEVLGEGKISHKESFRELWFNNPKKLLDYNLKDVLLVQRINEKLKITNFFNSIAARACSQLKNVVHTSTLVDNTILYINHNKQVFPSKKKNVYNKFKGAFCLEPTPGLYERIAVFDVKSLYPSLIETFNISPETFNPNGEIKISKDIGFNKGIGILSSAIKELKGERAKYKKLMYKYAQEGNEELRQLYHFRQYGAKVILNSVYGFSGWSGSRIYKPEVAEAVTILGQLLIKWTIKLLENKGYKVVGSDTDSVFFQTKSDNDILMFAECNALLKEVNKSYLTFAKKYGSNDGHLLIMEFEKIFEKILFVGKKGQENVGAKKRYAFIPLWYDDKQATNKLGLAGFGSKRSDTPSIVRSLQKTVLEMALNDKSKEEVIEYCKTIVNKIKNGEVSDEEFGFPTGINNELNEYGGFKLRDDGTSYNVGTPPVISGAIYSNLYLGTNFKKGDKPKWTYVSKYPTGFPKTHVITYEDKIPDGFEPNWKTNFQKMFFDSLNAIFLAMKWGKFPDLVSNTKKLGDYS